MFCYRKRFGNRFNYPQPETHCGFTTVIKMSGDTVLVKALLNKMSVLTKTCSKSPKGSPYVRLPTGTSKAIIDVVGGTVKEIFEGVYLFLDRKHFLSGFLHYYIPTSGMRTKGTKADWVGLILLGANLLLRAFLYATLG